jgi:hypothetical protein
MRFKKKLTSEIDELVGANNHLPAVVSKIKFVGADPCGCPIK